MGITFYCFSHLCEVCLSKISLPHHSVSLKILDRQVCTICMKTSWIAVKCCVFEVTESERPCITTLAQPEFVEFQVMPRHPWHNSLSHVARESLLHKKRAARIFLLRHGHVKISGEEVLQVRSLPRKWNCKTKTPAQGNALGHLSQWLYCMSSPSWLLQIRLYCSKSSFLTN